MLRNRLIALSFAALVAASTGCESMSNTASGALIGGGTGAGIGALAGGGRGALIGGLAGTAVGGLIGNDIDQKEKKQAQLAAAAAGSNAVGLSDVIQMNRRGMSDDVIMNQIASTHSTFNLSNEDLNTLKANNISDRLIGYMQSCRQAVVVRPAPVVYQPAPAVVYQPVPVYQPLPPPPPTVGVGVMIR